MSRRKPIRLQLSAVSSPSQITRQIRELQIRAALHRLQERYPMRPNAFFLLLLAGVTSAVQLYHEGHRVTSLSKRLASKKFKRASISPDIVPRGKSMANFPTEGQLALHRGQCMPDQILNELLKKGNMFPVENKGGSALIFRTKFNIFSDYFNTFVVKVVTIGGLMRHIPEFTSTPEPWTEPLLKKELDGLASVHHLIGCIKRGNKRYILMHNMGKEWSELSGHPPEGRAGQIIEKTEGEYDDLYAIRRRSKVHRDIRDCVFSEWLGDIRNGALVGEWRYAEHTGHEPKKPVDPNQHYCGISNLDVQGQAIVRRNANF